MAHNAFVSNIHPNDAIDPSEMPDEAALPLSDGNELSPDTEEALIPASEEEDATDESDVYLPIYNGEPVPIRADDRERITTLLREGLRFEKFLPQFEALREMSRAAGFKRPEDLILHLQRAAEQEEKSAQIPEDTDGRVPASPRTLEERLAEEYEELCEQIADSPDFSALPEEVLTEACTQGRPLLDCYLRFEQREQRRRNDAKQAEHSASACAVGSLYGNTEASDGTATTFRRAFRRSL